jgi:hypothetical protein
MENENDRVGWQAPCTDRCSAATATSERAESSPSAALPGIEPPKNRSGKTITGTLCPSNRLAWGTNLRSSAVAHSFTRGPVTSSAAILKGT